ncbi:MAG: hypothetical protein KBD66_01315 [Candidatus Doudnabacteria bacterium]|nr:hypothetical protein [Candidatus Doudnabacteria bacterium]
MQIQKIGIIVISVGLLAAGCSKGDGTAQMGGIEPTPLTADAASQVLTGGIAPQGWVPFEGLGGYTFFMPLSWYAQEAPGKQNHVLIGNSADLSASKPGSTALEVGPEAKASTATLVAAVTALGVGKSGLTKVVEGVTASGLQTASISYSENRGIVVVYGVQKTDTEFILVRVSGNTQDPFVGQIINSVAVRSL